MKLFAHATWWLFNSYLGIGAPGRIIGEILNLISIFSALIRYRKTPSVNP